MIEKSCGPRSGWRVVLLRRLVAMMVFARCALVPTLLLGWLAAVAPVAATAVNEPALTVQDNAGMFSPEAKEKANREIEQIKKRTGKDLLVETWSEPPAAFEKINKDDKEAVRHFFSDWAIERA